MLLAPDFIPGLLGWVLDFFYKALRTEGWEGMTILPPFFFFLYLGNSELLETALMVTVAGKIEKILADANKPKTRTTTKKKS